MNKIHEQMMNQILGSDLPEPEQELAFAIDTGRKWRFDIAWPEHLLAVEVDGGTWNGGRHVQGKGFENDCIKRNAATLRGWSVFNVTTDMVRDGRAIATIKEAFRRLMEMEG